VTPEPLFLGWTWRAHLDDLHRLVTEERWLEAAKRLSGLLAQALDRAATRARENTLTEDPSP
jgi:hypothetical protein